MSAAMDRRAFVATCAATCGGLMLGGCASLVTHPVPVLGGQVRLSLAAYPELAKPAGAIRIQPEGFEDAIYVLASPAGGEGGGDEFTALSPICTHRGCTVDVRGERLVCPCHGSTYDREGTVLRGPAERPLTRYAVQRSGETLVIELGGGT
ncbi:MAG: Rieske (2Fe-2S) protein [Gemmatimonadaceae bacterium]